MFIFKLASHFSCYSASFLSIESIWMRMVKHDCVMRSEIDRRTTNKKPLHGVKISIKCNGTSTENRGPKGFLTQTTKSFTSPSRGSQNFLQQYGPQSPSSTSNFRIIQFQGLILTPPPLIPLPSLNINQVLNPEEDRDIKDAR